MFWASWRRWVATNIHLDQFPMLGEFSNDKKVCVATIVVDSSRWIWLEIPLSENSIHVVTR